MNRKRMDRLLLCFLLVFMLVPSLPLNAGAPYYYPGYPQGTIGITMPEIGMQIYANGSKLASQLLYVDKERVDLQYDESTNRFYYQPASPLSKGVHEAKITVRFEGYEYLVQSWTFTISANAIDSFPVANNSQLKALQAANDYRRLMGLPEMTLDDQLNSAAIGHAQYLYANKVFSHNQEKGKTGFFGANVLDRSRYYGYRFNVYEDLSKQYDSSPVSAVDGLFDAPYHRIPFMDPAVMDFGYGRVTPYHALNFGFGELRSDTFVIYPTPDETGIPISWDGNEIPDPLRLYPDAKYPVGYPIMAGIYGDNIARVELITAALTKSDGTKVRLYTNSVNGNPADEYLTREIILIPQQPLKANEKYKVNISLKSIDRQGQATTYQRSWTFTTEAVAGNGKKLLHGTSSDFTDNISGPTTILFTIDSKQAEVNGRAVTLDVTPFIFNKSTYLPFRALGEMLQAEVNWSNENRTSIFKKGDTTIELFVDYPMVYVNGKAQSLDNGAMIISNRTMVPVRFISEILGAQVDWNKDDRTVTVTYE